MANTCVTVFLGLGSNCGDRKGNLQQALVQLSLLPDTCLQQVSAFHETQPVPVDGCDNSRDPWFLNAAVKLETQLCAEVLLEYCLKIEQALGRDRLAERRGGPRTLDIDVLFYGQQILNTEKITLPHPRAHERAFVLTPLLEIGSDFQHPVLGKTVQELYTKNTN